MALNGDCQKYSQSYDVVLKVGNKTFYLEKETLREKCAYFEAMFSGKFAEDSQHEVSIEMISATSMTFIVDYLYHRIVEIDDLSIVVELIEAAMFFQLAELVDSIVEILKSKISLLTWAKILQIAKVFNLSDLERKARCFGLFHFNDIRKNMDCIDNVATLHWYLSNVYLNADSEYDIFVTGCDWLQLNNIDSNNSNSILVILSCLNYKTLGQVSVEKILQSDLVSGNDLARQVIQNLVEINSQDLECVTSKTLASFLQNVNKSVSDIVSGFLTSVKDRVCVEQPCVIRKRKDTHLKKFNPKINDLVNWIEISNKDMWGHNLVVWRGFHIILLCGETCMGKNIWNKNILKYSILEEKWTILNSVPVVPRRHAAAVIHEDSIYIIGGVDSFRITLASVRRYDLLNDTWHALPDIPEFCQTPVATFHNGELYVSATTLYVFRNNQWVHLFKISMRHNTIISFRNHLYFSQNWSNCLNCWDTESLIEYMRPNEQLSKKSNYNITSMCLIGKSMYLLTEPEHFDKQAYYMERCHLEKSTLDTEILMEKVACSNYPFNSSECLVIPNLELEDRSINDFGKRWLEGDDLSNPEAEDDCNKTNCVLKVINSD